MLANLHTVAMNDAREGQMVKCSKSEVGRLKTALLRWKKFQKSNVNE